MKKVNRTVISILILLALVTGNIFVAHKNHIVYGLESSSSTETKNSSTDEKKEDLTVKEYRYNSSWYQYYILIVTNNTDEDVKVTGTAKAYNSEGKAISHDNLEIDVIGAGQTSIGYFVFDTDDEIGTIDYNLKTSDPKYYKDVLQNLEVEVTENSENIIVDVTNKGDYAAEFVEGHALFFDENNEIIHMDTEYFTDDSSEIKPDDTLTEQIKSYNDFDHAEVYFTGRSYSR